MESRKRYKELEKEYLTYNALDEKFIGFQKLCLDHPYLDVFDVKDHKPQKLNEEQQKQELIAFTLLFSIFERAYIMYVCMKQAKEIREEQWKGWEEYIQNYCQRPNFVEAWKKSGTTFDERFTDYMNDTLKTYGYNQPADSKQ
jgi:hypothetical protein